jgi:taurine dioxygenase
MLTSRPLSPGIGVVVENIDLSKPIPEEVGRELLGLFGENCILLVRDQKLTEENLGRAASWIGPLEKRGRPATVLREPDQYITKVSNVRENGKLIGSLPDGEMQFHADNCFKEFPNRSSFLYAVEIPSIGGNTLFANLFRAYDMLPRSLKERVDSLRVLQSYDYSTYEADAKAAGISNVKETTHPMVFRHPATGRPVLFVNRLMTKSIEGMTEKDSRELLDELLTYAEHPSIIYEHHWRPGDFLVWDNLSSNHARTDFAASERRLLLRGTTKGDYRPAFAIAAQERATSS